MNAVDVVPNQDPRVVEAFTTAAITALQELAQLEAFADDALSLEASPTPVMIAATIKLVRELPGTLTVLLTEEAASHLAACYLPPGTALTDEIVNDVAGEIANVIAGQAKTILKGTPYHFLLSTPSVARSCSCPQWTGETRAHPISVAFGLQRLLLVVQLPPCAGA